MFIVALNGSPKQDGNTANLLRLIIEEAGQKGANTEIIHVHNLVVEQKDPFCRACASPCPGTCYKDTPLYSAYETLQRADALVLGSPVYFGTVSAQLKSFWDKTRKLRSEKALINTVGGAVSCGAARFGGQETTLKALYDMMVIQGMIVVGDGHFEADAGHHGVCAQQPSTEDSFAHKRASILAQRLVEVAQATTSLRSR